MLYEEFEKTGLWLFRWRSYVPLLLVALLFVGLMNFSYPFTSHAWDQIWDLICYTIALTGFAVRIATVGFVPKRTSGRNTKGQIADTLNTTGMYSILRHPLYFGNFLMWMGVGLFPRVWYVSILMAAAFIFLYERIMFAEERFLRDKFGVAYEVWTKRTPVFWPRFRNWQSPALPFSWRSVLRRENSTLLGVTAIFFVLETIGTYVVENQFEFDPLWTILFLFTACVYVVLKILKKRHLLDDAGR